MTEAPQPSSGCDLPLFFDDRFLAGSHIHFSKKITDSIVDGISKGMYAIQIFLGGNIGYNRAKLSDKDVEEARKLLRIFPMKIFIHAPYTYNLAGSSEKNITAWTGNEEIDGTMRNIVRGLNQEISALNKVGGIGTVIHPGHYLKNKSLEEAQDDCITAIAKTLDLVEFNGKAKVLLENAAGQKGKIGSVFEHLARIRERSKNKEHIDFCIDTCHVWSAGIYDLSKIEGVHAMFQELDSLKEQNRGTVELFHLNDSKLKFNACADRHWFLGRGEIWGRDDTALRYLLLQLSERRIPFVLETSYEDMYTLHHLFS